MLSFSLRLLTLLALALAPIAQAAASAITWQAPTTITSADQALSQGGSILYAVGWTGSGTATVVTLANASQVTFQSGAINGTGLVQVTGAYGICGNNCAAYNGTTNANFNRAVGGFAYDGVQTIKLTGLTVGTRYLVELFSLDDRGCCAAKTQTFADSSGNTTQAFAHSANAFVLGSFVADATTETITGYGASGPCGGGTCPNLNAVVVYNAIAVPEPASLGLLGIALLGLGFIRARRHGAG